MMWSSRKIRVSLSVGFVFACLTVAFTNCSGPGGATTTDAASSQTPQKTCVPGPGATGSPKTIDEAVALINSLPMPVTLPCFIESLDRPLDLFATFSASSAQPSSGPENPRFFLFKGNLSLSVVPTGVGKNMVEFGQKISTSSSLKGELEFPINAAVPNSLPYERILYGSGTACRFCHTGEVSGSAPNSFQSELIRPDPQLEVTLPEIRAASQTCDPSKDAYRCELFKAILSFGQVKTKYF